MKYIDAEKLIAKIKELNLVTKTYDEQVAFNNALAMVVEIITSLQQEQPDEKPEYGYLSTEYVPGKKSRWSVGDVLAYYISTSNEEGECTLGKIVDIEFDEYDWFYIFEDDNVADEQTLVEDGVYKKN